MHKQLACELNLDFIVEPRGPLLIKSGREAGADPTLPDMNFVRTYHPILGETVYLPGSSLKGVFRSQAERIARTLGLKCCDPLDRERACDERVRKLKKIAAQRQEALTSARIYRELCTICRIFGHTVQASHLQISDAYPEKPVARTERRDGVAIDRISGAVAAGPFTLEVVTEGRFASRLSLYNFQLWQVGLLALVLRDMNEGRVPIGFGKSRGLGRVKVDYRRLEISYPGHFSPDEKYDFTQNLYGMASFPIAEKGAYRFEPEDVLELPERHEVGYDWGKASLVYTEPEEIENLLRATVAKWRKYAENPAWKG